jgi:ATP-dependent DNA helicase RecQ
MADLGQIEYTQGNQNIQIIFKNYEYIQINHNELEFRKKRLIRNYNTIKTYLEFGDCRQKYVLKYFDEKLRKKCGICDICLNSKEENYTQNEFKDYSERIEDLLSSGWAEMEDLIYLGTYLKRHKNKQMLKIFLKKGDFQILGNKILKDIQR